MFLDLAEVSNKGVQSHTHTHRERERERERVYFRIFQTILHHADCLLQASTISNYKAKYAPPAICEGVPQEA